MMKIVKSRERRNLFRTYLSITATILFSLLLLPLAVVGVQADAGDMVLCSSNASGDQGNANSYDFDITPDGRYVAFTSPSDNLLPGVSGQQAFRKDLVTSEVKLASCNSSGTQADKSTFSPSISADGRYVAFISDADNLGVVTATPQVFR
jgi:dipeptidyl aminopeptidase/acylaminoacyl peptidase